MIKVIKKDGNTEVFNKDKIIKAIRKSSDRVLVTLTEEQENGVINKVLERLVPYEEIEVHMLHKVVELALDKIEPNVAKSYREYRNYKTDFVGILDEVYQKTRNIMYIADKDNANTDSSLITTKRSLVYNELNKNLYKKFFLTSEEKLACKDGYIYVHDMSARRDTIKLFVA